MDKKTENISFYRYGENKIKELNLNLWVNISEYLPDLDIKFKERFYLFENKISNIPICYCGAGVKFLNMSTGFRRFCSRRCMLDSSEVKESRKNTNLEKYGVDNPSKNKDIRNKIEETNIKNFGERYPLMSKEVLNRVKDGFLDKYGVDNPSKVKGVRDKAKKTMVDRYGVEYAMHSASIKNDLKEYFISKYGVDNPFKLDYVRDKYTKTMIERYGVEHPLQNENLKNKMKITNLKKYGVEYPIQNEKIKDSIKSTNLEKYGFEFSSQSPEIKEKIKEKNIEVYKSRSLYDKIAESNLEKYGEIHISKNEIYRKRFEVSNHNNYIKYIGDGVSLFSCDCGENHEFEIDIQIFSKRKQGKYLCTICYPIESSKSISESDLYNYISSIYRGEIIQSYRDIMEIDIYLPEIKIGFEFNGVYWHSEKYKDKNYHSNKSFHFQEREIRIIHIWEDDWIDRKEIIKSQIKNWIGITENKLFARNCEVRKVQDIKIIKDFLNQNHIQGYTNNVLFLGLYYNDTLLSLMCFSKEEGRRNMGVNDWNLSRFCNKLNTNIVGGFSKLLNYFIKTYHPIRIISYADMGWSVGDVYYKSGFKLSSIVNPDYKYLVNGKRIHKSRFKKSKLGISGQLITESEFTKNLGISRIWDCGKMKFELFPDALKVKI